MRLCNTFLDASDCISAGHWGTAYAIADPLEISTIHRSRSVIAGRPRFGRQDARAH
jgi:hypothetical protein